MVALDGTGPDPSRAQTPSEYVESLCQACVAHAGVDGAGVSIITSAGHRATMCATDDLAATLEELQFTLGEGPCVDAVGARSPVLVADLHDRGEGLGERWPGFRDAAAAAGVRATFAFPLTAGAVTLGAMDLYRLSAGPLTPGHLRAALRAADAVAAGLLAVRLDRPGWSDDGDSGSSYRLVVHTATGMVSVQLGVPIEQALARLRATAYAEGRPIHDVAADVVARRFRYSEEES